MSGTPPPTDGHKMCGGAGDREGRPYAKKPPLPKGRGTNRRLVEGYLRGERLRVCCKFVREKNPPVTASPCQPPLGKGAEGTGERIATGALRPRNDGSRKNLRVIPRPVRRLVVGIRNTPAQRSRRTDCHSQCAHWLRNDREFYMGRGMYGGPM